MISSRSRHNKISRTALISIFAVLVGLLSLPVSTLAATRKVVRFDGVRATVPPGWPVFHLGPHSRVCVRFNRHAVYLGTPGRNQICPLHAVGRTEAILIAPAGYQGGLVPVSRLAAGPAAGTMARLVVGPHRAVVVATWRRDPALIRAALRLRSLRAAMLATNGHHPPVAPIPVRRRSLSLPRTVSATTPALPGAVYQGLGFDVCSTPSQSSMSAWGAASPYGAIGIYIGGVNAACLGGNLNAAWVQAESQAGWHLIPIYVGLQAPGGCCAAMSTAQTNGAFSTAAAQGVAAAQDAVAQAQALGIGTGNPIYYDMENYTRSPTASGAVLAFLQAWTEQLHVSGYMSGVYSSGSSGITDLVDSAGTSYVEPDELWTASWDSTAPSTPPTSPANPWVPAGDWVGTHQLLQYYSDPPSGYETYGGVTIGIDRDFVLAPTAAYGSGSFVSQVAATPSLTVKAYGQSSVQITPSWPGEPGVTEYTILGGASATSLVPIETVSAGAAFPVTLNDDDPYFEVQALNSLSEVIATSAPAQTPASVALFGNSAFVGSQGPVGIPAACMNLSPCRVQAAIYRGKRRLAEAQSWLIRGHGGQVLVPLSAEVHHLVAYSAQRRLPVTVKLTTSSGLSVTRPMNLVPYVAFGRAPQRRLWPGSELQVIGAISFVSNGWTGGVLVACKSSQPCATTLHLTLGGVALAPPRTQTLGAGQLGYLTYRLNNRGHRLLLGHVGNQLGARVTITSSAPAPTGTGVAASGTKTALALVSLDAFR